MKIILKGQNGLVAKSDNTRVAKPIIVEKPHKDYANYNKRVQYTYE